MRELSDVIIRHASGARIEAIRANGPWLAHIEVNGKDVEQSLIASGVVHAVGSRAPDWCAR